MSRPGIPAALRCLVPFAAGVFLAGSLVGDPRFLSGDASRLAPVTALAAAILVAAVPFLFTGRARVLPLVLAAAGFLRTALPAVVPPARELRSAVAAGDTVLVSGVAERVELRAGGRWRVTIAMTGITRDGRFAAAGASLSLAWPDSLAPPLEGASLVVLTVVQPLKGATNPGEWDARLHFRRHGIDYRATARRASQVVAHLPPPLISPGRALAGLRAAMGGAIDRRLDGFPRRFARVLLLGDRVAFLPEEESDFRLAGVTHVLSVSGLHVGLVAATVQILLGRRRSSGSLAVALGATWGYTLLVGAPTAAVRSAAMLTFVMVARHLRRALSGPPLVAGATFVLLLASPLLLFDLGFLLSVLSVTGLLAGHHLLSLVPRLSAARKPLRVGAETLAMTFSAQAATAPITIPLWGDWPLVAPLANLLVVGLSDLLLTAGLLALALELLHPAASDSVFAVTWALAQVVGWCVHQLASRSPGVTGLVAPPSWVPSACLVLAALALFAVTSGRRRIAGLLGGAWLVSFALLVACPVRPPDGLRVTVLDVGQGDATLLEFPDGRTMLIDAGEGGTRDTGRRIVLPALRAARIRTLDAVVVSHAHLDHQGGLSAVLSGFRVRRVFETGLGPPSGDPARFRDLSWARSAPICLVARGDTLLSGPGYTITALWPPRPTDPGDSYDRRGSELNDLSLVLELRWRGRRLVFPGDLEGAAEADLVALLPDDEPVDYLKAGHHGSRTSSTTAWIDRLDPRVVSVSAGVGNKFRHPAPEVMERFASRGVAVHRTDRGGAFRLTWQAGGVLHERWGDGLSRTFRRGFVRDGDAWPPEFLDAPGTIW